MHIESYSIQIILLPAPTYVFMDSLGVYTLSYQNCHWRGNLHFVRYNRGLSPKVLLAAD